MFGLCPQVAGLVWQPEEPTHFALLPTLYEGDKSIVLSPDARFVLKPVSGGRVKLYDLKARWDLGQVERPDDADSRMGVVAKFCPLSRRFAINDGHTISVYDTPELAEVAPR